MPLYVDVSGGYRLYQDPSAGGITGLAAAMGLHYTTALENANTLSGEGVFGDEFQLGNAANRFDVLNLSVGLYATLLDRHTAYMGIVAPLDNGTNRFFDMEAQMSLNFSY
jgi:hypothetical protein